MSIHMAIQRGDYSPEVLRKLRELAGHICDYGATTFDSWLRASKGDRQVSMSTYERLYLSDDWMGGDEDEKYPAIQGCVREIASLLGPDEYELYEDWPPRAQGWSLLGRLRVTRKRDDFELVDIWPVQDIGF